VAGVRSDSAIKARAVCLYMSFPPFVIARRPLGRRGNLEVLTA
jgi:hypothetical protein